MPTVKEFLTVIACLFFCLFASTYAWSQSEADRVYWTSTSKLTVDNFFIKTVLEGPNISYAQFSFNCNATGFDFFKKTFNKQVQNFMIPSASWIDTTKDVKQALLYQQTLFDLSEIFARRYRKKLRENRNQFLKGTDIVKHINDQILTDLSKERLRYEIDMMSDSAKQKQLDWTQKIQKELTDLDMYAYEK